MNKNIQPPIARKEPKILEKHGDQRVDPYYWMRDRENQEVIDYLNAENKYIEEVMSEHKQFEEDLFEELKGRIQEKDESVPYKARDYYYYVRYIEGGEYPIYCRKKGSLETEEEILIDANIEAKDKSYYKVGGMTVGEDQNKIAYAEDIVGRRIYTVRFRDLSTGENLEDVLEETTGDAVWAADGKTVFYTTQDKETLRPDKVWRHTLGTPQSEDVVVYEEKDDTFWIGVRRTKSRAYLAIESGSTLTTETRILKADDPFGEFKPFIPREREHEYSVSHFNGHFYIVTNWDAKNFRLMKVSEDADTTDKNNWEEVIAHRTDTLLEGLDIFKNFYVIEERRDGLVHIRIIKWEDGSEHYLDFGEETYSAWSGANPDFNTDILRFGYNSLTTPYSEYDYNMVDRSRVLLKQQKVLGKFDPQDYEAKRLYATAKDGVKVPISVVYKKGFELNGQNPLYMTGYGSYGISYDVAFSPSRISLMERGFAFAIAHIRGGEDLGRAWYEDGKMLKKKNTFNDFIACSEFLIEEKYTSAEKFVINGGSAGGLLMGVVVNARPDLYKFVISDVPFVDVVTTMLDESIPLTTGEYDEWGNPNEKKYYDYMLSYSPYDQVEKKDYPHMLVTSGLHDSQVQYWEPTKWVAKLREESTSDNYIMLKTNMDAGHSGASGRFQRFKEVAFEYATIFAVVAPEQMVAIDR
ncbi:S9 family peptidase [Flammeovirga aprica]|uniref:Proline-specific endopeptidase n=1 Tax=Flammeovirga aprica JL-4 TaxID=694437 RepID=A0A7X9P1T5_9BACT|nr:S9 family peptidase [Flammeovirga aprica]NME67633.1 S9 family peptidase [Flammeovirga aprica JL-4]